MAEWSNMDNAQLRELLEKGQILFQEEFAKVCGACAPVAVWCGLRSRVFNLTRDPMFV